MSIKGIFNGLKTNRKKSEPFNETEEQEYQNGKEINVNNNSNRLRSSSISTKESSEDLNPTKKKWNLFSKTAPITPTGTPIGTPGKLFFKLIN